MLMALAPNSLAWLFIGRILSGIAAASVSTANAYIADVTPAEQRAQGFGMMGVAFGIGFIIGPALGGVLGAIDVRLPFWVAGGLSFANGLYGLFVLPESLPTEKRATFSWAKRQSARLAQAAALAPRAVRARRGVVPQCRSRMWCCRP